MSGPKSVPTPDASDEERFFEKVEAGDPDECWTWTAYKIPTGYGQVGLGGQTVLAHRLSYRIHFEDPGESCVLHGCDNPSCVNPRHLRLGTQKENIVEASEKDRLHTVRMPGEENPNTPLTERDVRHIRARYSEDGASMYELASVFGVTRQTISNIVHRRTWGHVK